MNNTPYTVIRSEGVPPHYWERQFNKDWWVEQEKDSFLKPVGFRILVRDDNFDKPIRQRCITVRTETGWHRYCYVFKEGELMPEYDRNGIQWTKCKIAANWSILTRLQPCERIIQMLDKCNYIRPNSPTIEVKSIPFSITAMMNK
jgi:hypothetical protein